MKKMLKEILVLLGFLVVSTSVVFGGYYVWNQYSMPYYVGVTEPTMAVQIYGSGEIGSICTITGNVTNDRNIPMLCNVTLLLAAKINGQNQTMKIWSWSNITISKTQTWHFAESYQTMTEGIYQAALTVEEII